MLAIRDFGQPFYTANIYIGMEWLTKIMNDWHFG
jgi:hypothetical protein